MAVESGRWRPLLKSLAVHALIIAVLGSGWWMVRRQPVQPQVLAIEATVVDARDAGLGRPERGATRPAPRPEREPRPEPPPEPVAEPVPQPAPEPEPQPAPQPEPPTQVPAPPADVSPPAEEAARQAQRDREREQAAAAAAAEADKRRVEKQRLNEEQRLRYEQAARELASRQEAERKEAERVAAEKRAAEQQRVAAEQKQQAEEARQRAQRESELQRRLAAEERTMAARAGGLGTQWAAAIQARIQRAWIRPESARAGLDCTVAVTQVPGGEVVAVRVLSCNGDETVRQSIEAAVYRASPLPLPPDPALFERNLEVRFKPND